MTRAAALLLCGFLLTGCGLPRDPGGTRTFVRGGVMRVGVVHNPPWVIDHVINVDGVEARLVAAIANAAQTRIEWVRQPESVLMERLKKREIQLAIGGFDVKLPWVQEIAFTRPYLKTPDGKAHVLAAPPGESAWLLVIEQTLEANRRAVPSMLAEIPQ